MESHYPTQAEERLDPDFPVRGPSNRTARAAFMKESRMKFINANKLHRKYGGMGDPTFVAGWVKSRESA